MKLLVRDYLASLKERDELDAILPDLLSELGFTVFSRPMRGTQQRGVDIAAVGEDDDGENKVFLFSVKQGDLTRQDWDGTPQAMRSSLNEIRDSYIRNRIPEEYQDLKIVICLAFGGDVREQVRDLLTGYIDENTNDRISFKEWNGDKIAGLILEGILHEEILPKSMRSSFQKAVAMVDEPDVSYQHFQHLAQNLQKAGEESDKARVRSARQLNICLWILFVWARDVDNIESPYRASELALLTVWELLRPKIGSKTKVTESVGQAVQQLISLHVIIASEFIDKKVTPYAETQHGISKAIDSWHSLDINLALFEILGRIGILGLWLHWLRKYGEETDDQMMQEAVVRVARTGLSLIKHNPSLFLPITDRQATDIAIFLQLWIVSGLDSLAIASWLTEMSNRLDFSVSTKGRYPTCSSNYRDLAEHPRDKSEDYFKDATAGSTLIPLIAAWLQGLGQSEAVETLSVMMREKLEHCTLQLWMPDENSEEEFYLGNTGHGKALCDLPLSEGGEQLLEVIKEACRLDTAFETLSPIKTGYWPVIFVACHHYQLPIPPKFWIDSLMPPQDEPSEVESVEA